MFTPLSYELIPRATEQEAKLTIPKFYRLDWSAYPKHCEEFDLMRIHHFKK
jgi:hypothetical protein